MQRSRGLSNSWENTFPGTHAIDSGFRDAFPGLYASLELFSDSNERESLRVIPLAASKKSKSDWKGGVAELRALGFINE